MRSNLLEVSIVSVWNGFKRLDFRFEDHEAILVVPDVPDLYAVLFSEPVVAAGLR